MHGEASSLLTGDVWSSSPTGSESYDPYYRVGFKSTDLSILTESLQRLDNGTRKMRAELSHQTDLVHALTSVTESVLSSELNESLKNLCRYVTNVEDEIDLIMRQVDLERNDRAVQQRMIASLQATLAEADRQLDQALNSEKQAPASHIIHCTMERPLISKSSVDYENLELSGIDAEFKPNYAPAIERPMEEPLSFSIKLEPPFDNDPSQRHQNVPTPEKVTPATFDPALLPECQRATTSDEKVMRDPTTTVKHSHIGGGQSTHSLDQFSCSDQDRSSANRKLPRNRSVDSLLSSSHPHRPDTGVNTVFQSWLVQRIQCEMRRRHRTEAMLAETQHQVEQLRATETELLDQIEGLKKKKENSGEQGLIIDQADFSVQDMSSVQQYLFESMHYAQLPVTESSNVVSGIAKETVNALLCQNDSPPSRSHVQTHPLTNGNRCQRLSPHHNYETALPDCFAFYRHSDHPFRRHFSEPDLLVSCQSIGEDLPNAFNSSGVVDRGADFPDLYSSFPQSKRPRRTTTSASALERGLTTASAQSSDPTLNPGMCMWHFVSLLRESHNLLLQLMQFQKGAHLRSDTDRRYLHSCVHRYAEELEVFRSSVLRAQEPCIDRTNSFPSPIFPRCLCRLLRLSDEPGCPSSNAAYSNKHPGCLKALEEISKNPGVWKDAGALLLSSEDSLSPENLVETLVIKLNETSDKLRAQIEQCNELETLLAERDGRIAAQATELAETEAHLAASTETVASLHREILSGNRNWTQLLQRMQNQLDPCRPGSASDQLPALPAVLNLVRNLDAAYAELQESEKCRILAEQRATSALSTARRLRCQLRDHMITEPTDSVTLSADPVEIAPTKHCIDCAVQTEEECAPVSLPGKLACDVGVQSVDNQAHQSRNSMQNEIFRFGFSRPQTTLEHPQSQSEAEQVAELREALRNALAQVDRLQKYRITQKARYEQLQQRFVQMNSELDATVDVLRHHQTSSEVERRRTSVELSQLRTQLAKANSLLEHYKTLRAKSNPAFVPSVIDGGLSVSREASASPVSPRSSSMGKDRPDLLPSTNFDDLALQLSMTQAELSQLRSDMADQKAAADREATSLRGQLAESNADVRSLRLQINRLQTLGSNGRGIDSSAVEAAASCPNCQRLQRLLDLLQAKTRSDPDALTKAPLLENAASHIPSTKRTGCDRSCQVDLLSVESTASTQTTPSEVVSTTTPVQLQRWETELREFEQSLRVKDAELQKENGRLSFESDRLKRKQEALVDRETKLKEEVESHEAHVELQRVELQNDLLRLGRERTALTQERQMLDSEREHLHRLEADLKQKRWEAEVLIEMATRERGVPGVGMCENSSSIDQKDVHSSSLANIQSGTESADGPTSGSITVEQHQLGDDFERAVAFLLDWLRKSLDQTDTYSFLPQQSSADVNDIVAHILGVLTSNVNKLRAQWMNEGLAVPTKVTLTEAAPGASEQNPVEVTTEQLLRRLRAAEKEAMEATEQLKSSNTEFLSLRERLSHAMVERAHLKASVEGLDEEVSRLQSGLYERTQQLNACQAELARFTGRVSVPLPTNWFAITKESLPNPDLVTPGSDLQFAVPEATIISLGPVSQRCINLSRRLQICRIWSNHHLDHLRHFGVAQAARVQSALQRLTATRLRLRLQSQPRPRLLLGFFIYLFLVHFLLLRCWLL